MSVLCCTFCAFSHVFHVATLFPFIPTQSIFLPNLPHLPEKVAAEDEAEHEDEEADAQHNDIHIEREVIDLRRHAAVVFKALTTQTTQASWQEELIINSKTLIFLLFTFP